MTSSAPDPEPSSPTAADTQLRARVADRLRDSGTQLAESAQAELLAGTAADAEVALLGAALARLQVDAVRSGRCDPRGGDLIGLAALVERLGLEPADLFDSVYRQTMTALGHLDRDPALGAASPHWPAVSAAVQRAAFDLLAAWTTRTLSFPTAPAITDDLTTLHTRAMFDTVLAKESQRAERFEHWLSILLIEVNDLAAINRTRGYGVGDQVLERLGILIRRYFRQHDWVARYSDHAVAVLLAETGPEDAATLAGLMRTMIKERLAADDERQQPMAVSVAVVSARPLSGHPIDADRIVDELDSVLERWTADGSSRIESVEIHPVVEIPEES